MIDAAAIAETISTYNKYGWILRRVLLSAATEAKLGNSKNPLFGEAAITKSEIDAAWFSRPPREGSVAWEIRYLGETPFALLANIDENDPAFESSLREVESRLRESVARKQTA